MRLRVFVFAFCLLVTASTPTLAQAPIPPPAAATPIPPSITTPNTVETSIGTLHFEDGIPSPGTADKVYDQLDLQRGVATFLNGLRGVSIYAARHGMRNAGLKDNDVLIFSGLMEQDLARGLCHQHRHGVGCDAGT